eukprot:COSAG04_NODE_5848_length_1474_cov_1.051636_1_plen_49_part_10
MAGSGGSAPGARSLAPAASFAVGDCVSVRFDVGSRPQHYRGVVREEGIP